MAEFNPDDYLGPSPAAPTQGFNPDDYLGPPPAAPQAPQAPASKAYTGKVFPFSQDESGKTRFDPRAGILGGFLALPELAGDVSAGRRQVDVNDPKFMGDVLQGAMTYGPKPPAGLTTTANTPSTTGLKKAGEEGFQAYRDSNQVYDAKDYVKMLKDTKASLKANGLEDIAGSASHAHKVLDDEIADASGRSLVFSHDVDRLRIALGKHPKAEAAGGMQAREGLFKFIEDQNPGEGGKVVRDAVANYRQGKRSEVVEDALKKQEDLATAKNTKPNAEQIRTNIAKLIHSKEVDKWSPEDTVGLNAALKSTLPQRVAQTIGKNAPNLTAPFSPVSAGLLGVPATAASYLGASHPVAAGVGAAALGGAAAAGAAARSYANRGARNLANEASEAVRQNSPLFRSGDPQLSFVPSSRNSVTRAIVTPQLQPEPQPIRRVLPDGTIEELS